MSYKYLRISGFYPKVVKDFENKYSDSELSFKELINVANNYVNTIDIEDALINIGVDANVIFANVPLLQDKWKEENLINLNNHSLIYNQIKVIKPNVLFLNSTRYLSIEELRTLRKEVKELQSVICHFCAPFAINDLNILKEMDLVISCTPKIVADFKFQGLNSKLVYHSFKKDFIDKFYCFEKENSLLFAGSLLAGDKFHKERIEMLDQMITKNINVKILGNVQELTLTNKIAALPLLLFYKLIPDFLKDKLRKINTLSSIDNLDMSMIFSKSSLKRLKVISQKPVFGENYYKNVSQNLVNFNSHINITNNSVGNMRMFEVTALGSCLLTDNGTNINDIFEPGKEVIVYNNLDDALEKSEWLMHNINYAKEIADNGHKRVLKEHTHDKRAQEYNEIFCDVLRN
jgi:hypothetical protein